MIFPWTESLLVVKPWPYLNNTTVAKHRYCIKQQFKILGIGCSPGFCRIVQYPCPCLAIELLDCNQFMKALQLQSMVLGNGHNLGEGSTRAYIAFIAALHIFILEKLMFEMQRFNHALLIYYINVVELSSTMLVCLQIKVLKVKKKTLIIAPNEELPPGRRSTQNERKWKSCSFECSITS